MDENYIDMVRKSLYGVSKENVKVDENMPRNEKKIRFAMDRYNSENAFTKISKSGKLENRICTPFKTRESKNKASLLKDNGTYTGPGSSSGCSPGQLKNGVPTPFKNTSSKKKRIVVSFSSSDLSFEEDLGVNSSPSKSEREVVQNTLKKSKRDAYMVHDTSSESDESVSDFNFDSYCNNLEMSFNESITEARSGIHSEILGDDVGNVTIHEADLLINGNCCEQTVHETSDSVYENNVVYNVEGSKDNVELANHSNETPGLLCDENIAQDIHEGEEATALTYSSKYYDLDGGKLVVIKASQSIYFHGIFCMKVLYGKVEVLGNILNANSNIANLYSPRGTALLYIKNAQEDIATDESIKLLEITAAVPSLIDNDNLYGVFIESGCAVIHCTKLEDVRINFIEKYISQQIFPKADIGNTLRAVFDPTDNWNFTKSSDIWDEVLGSVQPTTKLLLAGGKGVGKSTLLRFAINRLLSKFDKIRVIDLDPGQSEFSVPGCVSVVTVTEPIFGPSYTHLKVTDRSLLSDINVANDPNAYIRCVQSLMEYSEVLEACPTLINYMGFTHGIGIPLISSVITYIQPTDVVQITSRSRNKNFRFDLTPETVYRNRNLFRSNSVTLSYDFRKIQAMSDGNDRWTLEPRQAREMCILAYFGQMMPRVINSLVSHYLHMHQINLTSIKFTNLQKQVLSPAVANANLVALCSLDDATDLFICMGYGVVRGIDLESGTLILLTPEKANVLEEVYYLVIGSVSLPPSIYMTPDDVKGHIPYVISGELVLFGQITKRSYLPSSVIKKQ